MRIVVLGAVGQLGQALCRALPGDVIALTRADVDVTDTASLRQALTSAAPAAVINATGYTHVDRAEAEPHAAFAANSLAVREMALLCRDLDAVLVHLSTNYVFGFDALRDSPYDEDDTPGPVSVYGASKLAGEQFVRALWPKHFILRTSGLYGSTSGGGRGNFVDAMLRQARAGDPVRVVADQLCTPTSIDDVADAVNESLRSKLWGLYHVTNAGACTWHEFAEAIFEMSGLSVDLVPISTLELGAAAKRPRYSVLSNRRWLNAGFAPLRPWRDALTALLTKSMK
jgi:dTDP-4-dehydrorhamnose reductase